MAKVTLTDWYVARDSEKNANRLFIYSKYPQKSMFNYFAEYGSKCVEIPKENFTDVVFGGEIKKVTVTISDED